MGDFRGERRINDTHESTTDDEAMLMRKGKGKEAKLSDGAHALMEHRNALVRGPARGLGDPDRDRGGQTEARSADPRSVFVPPRSGATRAITAKTLWRI